jgi:ubiquinone/menaquinone biosynthesis C-methylase UbiE
MAHAAGPSGRAVGLDVDAEALALGRQAAQRAGVRAAFVDDDISEPPETDAFDLVYARLVLSHLLEPANALRAMRAAARAAGAVAVEDLYLGTLRSEPPAPALDELQRVYGATVRQHGGDPTIGPRLPALLTHVGLEDVTEQTVENPIRTVEEKLFLAQLVHNMRSAILQAGAATAEEISALEASVADAARDPDTVFYQARMHQVWGRRPR